MAIVAGLGMFYIAQFLFYNGELPCENRYDFPGMLVVPLIWATVGWMMVRIVEDLGKRILVVFVKVSLLLALVLIVYLNQDVEGIRAESKWNARSTCRFTQQMIDVAGVLKGHGDLPLTLVVREETDYEKTYAVLYLLRYHAVTNDIYLEYHGRDVVRSPFNKLLQKRLAALSVRGEVDLLSPIHERHTEGYSLEMSKGGYCGDYCLGRVEWW
jgi:hypothetical protein